MPHTSRRNARIALPSTLECTSGSAIAYIQRLPDELLIEIFSAVPVELIDAFELDHYYEIWPFVTLSHVCSRWRDIILSTKTFWSTIDPSHDRHRFRPPVAVSLARSVDAPLTVRIGRDARNCDVDQIIDHCRRWRRARFNYAWGPSFFPKVSQNLPILEDLYLSFANRTIPPAEYISVFQTAPMLRTLSLEGYIHLDLSHLAPWSQLVTLNLTDVFYAGGIHSLLRQSPSLRTARLNESLWDWDTKAHPMEPYISHISDLIIRLTNSSYESSKFLAPLTLPFLTKLKIDNSPGSYIEEVAENIISLLQRSQCTLTHFDLCNVPSRSADLLAILELTPTLTTFMLTYDYLTWEPVEDPWDDPSVIIHNSLRKLTYNPSSPTLLPNLDTFLLHVGIIVGDHFFLNKAIFFTMLHSRVAPPASSKVACLRDVTLQLDGFDWDNLYMYDDDIRKLRLQGMELDVSYNKNSRNVSLSHRCPS